MAIDEQRPDPPADVTLDRSPSVAEMVATSLRSPVPVGIPRLPSGTLINGRYLILGLVGSGGMGVVYRATDQLQGRSVALKTLSGAALRRERLSLFKSEFKTLADLRHPNIASVYDFEAIQGSGDFCFTMELVEGRDLFKAAAGADIDRIVELLVQVCRALSYLHSRRLMHSDLKPANVLVDRSGVVKVVDFGLAGEWSHAAGRGTPAYMAPEAFSSDATIDARADLYSLGILAYEILWGRLPFSAADVAALRTLHATAPLPLEAESPRQVPRWLARIVDGLCKKEPSERFRSANAVLEAFNELGGRHHTPETAETRESYLSCSRLVGRGREQERLFDFVWRATGVGDGAEAAILVGGVSGSGKSRLVREAKHRLQLAGLPFVETDCDEGALSGAGPLGDVARHVARLAEAVGASDLLKVRGLPLRLLQPEPNLPEAEPLAVVEQLSELLTALAERVPYGLYFNDLQWARRETVELITNLTRRIRQRRVAGANVRLAIIGSFRSDEIEARPASDLLKEPGIGTVLLAPLGSTEVGELVGAMLGVRELPAAFVARVAAETSGNPFFVEEVVRSLIDLGTVSLESGHWKAAGDIGDLEIPATIANAFRRRAGLLDPHTRATLDLMAAANKPMEIELLAECSALPADVLHASLRTLVSRQMVVMASDRGEVRLTHDRIRETLLADLPSERRRSLHDSIARALERTRGTDGPHLNQLAYQYYHAGDAPNALRTSLLAGTRAQQAYSNDAAAEHLEHALELLGDQERQGPIGFELRERLADLDQLTGRYGPAQSRLLALVESAGTVLDKARLLRKLGGTRIHVGDLEGSLAPLWQALELLGGAKEPRGKFAKVVLTLRALGRHLLHRAGGPVRRARDEAERARLREISTVFGALSNSLLFLQPSMVLATTLSACNAAERAGESSELCEGFIYVAFLYSYLGLQSGASHFGDRALALAERIGSPHDRAFASVFRGMMYSMDGDFDRALPLSERGKELLLAHGDLYLLTISATNLGSSYLRLSTAYQSEFSDLPTDARCQVADVG